jgi:hypothetical protein
MAESKSEEQRNLLSTLRDISLICGVYLYFIGWTYEFYFFSHFGISLAAVEIPVYYFGSSPY